MSLFSIAIIHLMATISPGQDIVMVFRNSLKDSWKSGVMTAVGICIANFLWILASDFTNRQAMKVGGDFIFNGFKILGALYLAWIGLNLFKSFLKDMKLKNKSILDSIDLKSKKNSYFQSFLNGFLTNILNVKAGVYFLSIGNLFFSENQPLILKIQLILMLLFITFFWFSFVSLFIWIKAFREFFQKKQYIVEGISGIMLMVFSASILFSGFM